VGNHVKDYIKLALYSDDGGICHVSFSRKEQIVEGDVFLLQIDDLAAKFA
jgi:hypothetical protein